jgi:hypothetical protein
VHPWTLVIRSGGQTGVDRAALDCAVARGLPYAGWCPQGGWAEDCPEPPGLLERYPYLNETPSAEPEQRTAWNVRDSDATLIIVGLGGLGASPGTKMAARYAQEIFERTCHLANAVDPGAVEPAAKWLARVAAPLAPPAADGGRLLVLNVAGPRESESPGIYTVAGRFLEQVLENATDTI